MESTQGHALVASPYLTEPNFLRSVIYIVRHDEDGALGLILNRPTDTTVGSLLEHLSGSPVKNSCPVYCGGPVDGPLMLLHRSKESQANESKIFIDSDQMRILETCSEPNPECRDTYRVFDGYSGWGAGQLESELMSGGWLIWEISPEQVFGDSESLWQTAVRDIGRDIIAGGIDASRIPDDPAFN